MSVSNAEHLEEILYEAHAYGVRLEVIQLANKLQDDDKTLQDRRTSNSLHKLNKH